MTGVPGVAAETAGLISIVIPAWGAHVAYVPDALQSLYGQAGSPIEVLVVDNASEPPVSGLDRAEVVRSLDRLTVGRARNFGLERARGEYVMFWDADDLMLPGALERMRIELEHHPEVVAVTMDSVTWTPEAGPGVRWPWPRAVMYRLAHRPHLFALIALLYNPFTTTGPALMRTASVRDAGGFAEDIAFLEDWALSASLTVRGRISMLRETGRLYRVHDASLSRGHLDSPDQGDWLRGIRARTRRDPRVPRWLKASLPLVRLHHLWRERRAPRKAAGAGYYESALTGHGTRR